LEDSSVERWEKFVSIYFVFSAGNLEKLGD